MQHVNVRLQALLKGLRKACREKEKEGGKGKRGKEWQVCGEKQRWEQLSLCSVEHTANSRRSAARGRTTTITTLLHNQPLVLFPQGN